MFIDHQTHVTRMEHSSIVIGFENEKLLYSKLVASKLYGVNATILIFVFVFLLYCIFWFFNGCVSIP